MWLVLARRRPRWIVRGVAGALVVSIAVPLGLSVGGPALRRAGLPGDWIVVACDVGQGDAVLVRDGDAVALIDTGPDEAALERCLGLVGVEHIDLLVLTHWDADHVAAVAAVAGRVATVIHGPLDGDRSAGPLRLLADGGAVAHEVVEGVRGRLGEAEWDVMWPPAGQAPGNDASVVLDLQAAEFRGVFLGDLGEAAQAHVLADARPGRVDLVKVAHHGSADQSAALYAELGATVGIIGVGAGNGYGHPTGSLLDMLAAQHTAVVRTDDSGTAVLSVEEAPLDEGPVDRAPVEDAGFRVWTERAPPEARGRERLRRRRGRSERRPCAPRAGPRSGGRAPSLAIGDEVAHDSGEAARCVGSGPGARSGVARRPPAGFGRARPPLARVSHVAHDRVAERDPVGVGADRLDGRPAGAAEARVIPRTEVGHLRDRGHVDRVGTRRHGGSVPGLTARRAVVLFSPIRRVRGVSNRPGALDTATGRG
ncbi:ComEC/Rec2 family competence protein [Agromyces aerolatus]|uniref:ComEC/Rec2 family competence protein n=1 Tax=Agromyces sp. LY-1074 TaxID=3074080 RepID=UPI002857A6B2|nr:MULTISPECIES: MBL fold metallo-hydrolase [unclassified Agromyces]MDR5700737.1 MBL fold metallo-hydrolase [Agromyces sp. LY-1074]MDR5707258.1 MBL fold metallo-hydrolase [Agromyces sp. LY-1358]